MLPRKTRYRFLVTLIVVATVAFASGFACGTEQMMHVVKATLP